MSHAVNGTAAMASKPRPPIDVESLRSATAEDTALALLRAGYHPTVIYPPSKDKEGKDPIGKAWGLDRPTEAEIRSKFRFKPDAGVGLCMGARKAPGGRWLADFEGDGPQAFDSLLKLVGGEVVETVGWSSARGEHRLFVVGDDFLDAILAAGGIEGEGEKGKATYHLVELPDLEIRVGGFKKDGVAKQVQSVVPPTLRTDGEPREWFGPGHVAELPDAAVAFLEILGERRAIQSENEPDPQTIPINPRAFTATVPREGDPVEHYTKIGVEKELKILAETGEGGRNNQLNKSAGRLGMFVAAGVLSEDEAVAGLLDACRTNGTGDTSEARATIRSGLEYGKGRPRDLSHVGARSKPPTAPRSTPTIHVPPVDFDDVEIVDRWPTLNPAAFYGLAGDLAMMADPHTEAAPIATMVQFMAAFGCMLDRTAHFKIGPTQHYLKLNVALTGKTSMGRKGTSWDICEWTLGQVDPKWSAECIQGGLVSGEGLIHHVRDDRYEDREVKDPKTKQVTRETVLAMAGVAEKRLLVVETEMSRMLKAAARESNTLSDVIRQAWETDRLRTMGKLNPSKATGAHVSIIAHTTEADVRKHLTEADANNGFANRFLWVLTRRSKMLPDGGDLASVDWRPIVDAVRDAAEFARYNNQFRIDRDPEASKLWRSVYPKLTSYGDGYLSRAAPYVLRIASIHAVLDRSTVMRAEHLEAALALWDYCEASARMIFGVKQDPDEAKLLDALEAAPQGLTRKQVNHDVFQRNMKADALASLLSRLLTGGSIRREFEPTGGRPAERYYLAHVTT